MRSAAIPNSWARAHEPDRPLRVAELDRVAVTRAEPVPEHERGDTHRVEQIGNLTALVIHRQVGVTAARRYHDPRGIGLPRPVHGNRRSIRVIRSKRTGSAVRPE